MKKAVDISCLQVDMKILLYSFLAWIARTWLDCKKRGLSGLIWVTFQLLVEKHFYQRFESFRVASKSQLELE